MGASGLQFGCFGGTLGVLEVSWVPWLAPLGPDWRLGSQPLNFSQFFHVILGAILDDFWETKSIKKSLKISIDFLMDFDVILSSFWKEF